MIIEACIFDLDGVIVDTAKYHYQAWRSIANQLGFDFSWKENEKLKGVSRVDSLEIILKLGGKSISDEKKSELLIKKNDLYLEHIINMNPEEILPGVEDILNEIKHKGLKIGLGSASKNARPILKKTELLDFFDAIVDGNEVSRSKPDPEVFQKGADLLKVKPENCIVFEDSFSGVIAANNGGFHSVGIGSSEFLHNADVVIPSFDGNSLSHLIDKLIEVQA